MRKQESKGNCQADVEERHDGRRLDRRIFIALSPSVKQVEEENRDQECSGQQVDLRVHAGSLYAVGLRAGFRGQKVRLIHVT